MRMIPDVLRTVKSDAELRIHSLLAAVDLGPGWVSLHSLNVPDHHPSKQWAEIDFLIIGPPGVFGLEVKGGGIRCVDGKWYGVDRRGHEHQKAESPFDQVRDAVFALRTALRAQPDAKLHRGICMGWGLAFPDTEFDVSSVEHSPRIVADESQCAGPRELQRFLENLAGYWRKKLEKRRIHDVDDAAKRGLLRYLRPNFELAPRLSNVSGHLHEELVRLTDEQYEKLDAIDEADRIVCSGGAGTGKSFIAMECARREAAREKSVAVVVESSIFSGFLLKNLVGTDVRVFTLSELESEMARDDRTPFDVLIVDEGQDILDFDALDILDRAAAGGLEQGRWRWFMDENNQAGIVGNLDADALQALLSFSEVRLRLKHNCRNTPEIVTQTQLATGADIGEAEVRGIGLPPQWHHCEPQDLPDALETQLAKWEAQGVSPGDIAILSPSPFGRSSASRLPSSRRAMLTPFRAASVDGYWSDRIVFASVREFKGLERAFVAVIDLGEAELDEESIAQLYVAMTRANMGLWIGGTRAFIDAIDCRKRDAVSLIAAQVAQQKGQV